MGPIRLRLTRKYTPEHVSWAMQVRLQRNPRFEAHLTVLPGGGFIPCAKD